MSALTKSEIAAGCEPIPGYVLRRRLGSGGFGEVWLADAPGGLEKAIKFVFGAMGDKRAARELKSLERLRGVNHPFLLTLERFESVDGQLVIVTELADGSLENAFRACLDRGDCGIPRGQLLGYMQDTADALDYLSVKFRLQHLDVKPANLLLVGGHVKVGDFGLLKDLQEMEKSVVGGLTPIYAAPEVFDGRPSTTSDQYSLAVVYQELLTGVRPFRGRTLAQLATQHVHTAPNLDPLPPMDRPVVAKALEKNPERRFNSCMEFIEALREHRGSATTLPVGRSSRGDEETTSTTSGAGTVIHRTSVEDLASLSIRSDKVELGTDRALVVALGGTGADCLACFREQHLSLPEGQRPGVQSLLIDTDDETVQAAKVHMGDEDGDWQFRTVHAPLRKPADYRRGVADRYASVSRRWLYNLPRSGKTEGLRPLGRLAMIDHGGLIAQQITEALQQVIASSGGARPKVYVVSSLDGGTGGGMVWDVVHLIRNLLDQLGQVETEIIPLLVAASMHGESRRPLALADTTAALGELFCFQQPGHGYPGDAGLGWASVPAARSPLKNLYVMTRGDQMEDNITANSIATYMRADLSLAGSVMHAAREQPEAEMQQALKDPEIRSQGIWLLQTPLEQETDALIDSLAFQALKSWAGPNGAAKLTAQELAGRISRDAEVLAESLRPLVWQEVPEQPAERLELLFDVAGEMDADWLASPRVGVAGGGFGQAPAEPGLDKLLRRPELALDDSEERVREDVENMTRRLVQTLGRYLENAVDAETLIEALQQILEETTSSAERFALSSVRRSREADEMRDGLLENAARHPLPELLGSVAEPGPVMRYLDLRLAVRADQKLAARLRPFQKPLDHWIKRLRERKKRVESAAKLISGGQSLRPGAVHEVWNRVDSRFAENRKRLEGLAARCLVPEVWYRSEAAQGDAKQVASDDEWVARIRARLEQLVPPFIERYEEQAGNRIAEREAVIKEALSAIRPELLDLGGLQRVVLVVGRERDRERFAESLSQLTEPRISVAYVKGAPMMLLHEAQGIPLASLLSRLQLELGNDAKVVAKLRARCDVHWQEQSLT